MPHALVNTGVIWDTWRKDMRPRAAAGSPFKPGTNLCSLINESNDTLGIASIRGRDRESHCINKTAKIILMYYDLPLLFVYRGTATPSTVINRPANGK